MDKFGFVVLVGAPNAGKSTLINNLVKSKVSITSPKIQTTRSRVLGITVWDQTQVVFIDTPGVFKPRKRFDRAMVQSVWESVKGADKILFIVDVEEKYSEITRIIAKRLSNIKISVDLVLNKIDLIKRERLLDLSSRLNEEFQIEQTFMISAKNGDGVDNLIKYLVNNMPSGNWLYPKDQLSDMPDRLLAEEITREKIFHFLHQELPYSVAIGTENWKRFKDGSIRIEQVIYVQNVRQKMIVLGKNGKSIKRIGIESRRELENLLGSRIHLFIFVKVRENWLNEKEQYEKWGLNYNV